MNTFQIWDRDLDPGPYKKKGKKEKKMNLHNWQLHSFLSFRIVFGSLFFMSRMQYVKKKVFLFSLSLFVAVWCIM